MKRILLWSGVIAITVLMLAFPLDSVTYARNSLVLCFDTIIPSLFPFFVCSGLLVYSGFCEAVSVLARPLMKPFFNVNENGSGAFILGIISGYPLGAVTACQLYESGYISKYEAERLLSFCNNSGPLFIMGAMGVCMYSSNKVGILLYMAHIMAALTSGIVFRFYKRNKHSAPKSVISHSEKGLSHIYSTVMQNSLNSIITICGSIVFFGVVSNLALAHLPIEPTIKSVISGILEMTGGAKSISSLNIGLATKLVLTAIIVGFAGMCVHLQVMSTVSRYNLSLFPYILGKILHGILSGVYLLILLKFFPVSQAVFAQNGNTMALGFFIGSVFVCISVISFLTLSLISFLCKQKEQISK